MSTTTLLAMTLPDLIMTPTDVSRLRREVTALDEYMQQQRVRTPGKPTGKLPKTSRLLDELAMANGLNLLESSTRKQLSVFLTDIALHAPVMHISFAADPSSAFLQKIVIWFRKNIDPHAIVRVGLQPAIAAGCILRTTNKYFDLSLRQRFLNQRHLLRDALLAAEPPTTTPPAVVAAPVISSGVSQ